MSNQIDSKEIKQTQTHGLKRDITDKYYTNKKIIPELLKLIQANIDINKNNDIIIEPSAGNGSFITFIKKLVNKYYFYDLFPECDEIIKQDYLSLDYSNIVNSINGKIHLLGNPPFGRQSSTALKFIKYSTKFCDTISFILPKSFKKESVKNKIPLNFHCILEHDIPKNSFLLNNVEYDVPCVFQIWEKRNIKRVKEKKLIPYKFKFVKKTECHDISFRRVGVYAGKINTNTTNNSIQSHNFIKFDEFSPEHSTNDKILKEIINKLEKIKFSCCENTVGPKSISKQELIKEYNKVLSNY
jgi:predicted RNA methylase